MKGIVKIILVNLTLFLLLDRVAGTLYFKKTLRDRDSKKKSGVRVMHPDYHHGLKPLAKGMETWGRDSFLLCTNSLGMRDREPRQVSWASDRRRVVWIGDSFTEGLGVEYEASFMGLFALQAPADVEHLNMGVVSYSPELYARKLEDHLGKGLRIDTLVVCLDNSDIQDEILYHSIYYQSPTIHVYMDPVPEGPAATGSSDTARTVLFRLKSLYRNTHSLAYLLLEGFLRDGEPGDGALSPWDKQYNYERAHVVTDTAVFRRWGHLGLSYMEKNMDRIREMARDKGFQVRIVIYPWPNHVTAGAFDNAYTRFWEDYCARHGIRLVNVFESFRDLSDRIGARRAVDSLYIRGDMHFTRAGNRFLYEAMRKAW
jgi:hypothetical protein